MSKATERPAKQPARPSQTSPFFKSDSRGAFFQPKLQVGARGDRFEQEADRAADHAMAPPAGHAPAKTPFFSASPRVQRQPQGQPQSQTGTIASESLSLTYEQAKDQPGFEEWKEKQTAALKLRLWENQPADLRAGIITFGLSSVGILGSTLALDPHYRREGIDQLQNTNVLLPLALLPYSEYLPLSGFKYKLPTAANAPYTFQTEFDFDAWFKLARERWNIPKVSLGVGVDSAYKPQGGFSALTGGNIKLKFGGGIVNLSGFFNDSLPPTPMLISDPARGDSPTWLMRSFPDQLEANLPKGSGVFLTVDVQRLPELFKSKVPERDTAIQRKEGPSPEAHGRADSATPSVDRELHSGTIEALPQSTRAFMEQRFGQDFSGVRIHASEQAAESAQSINARAYTSGNDIVFNAGEYQPHSPSGQRLLAHELVHTVQQTGGERKEQSATPSVAGDPRKLLEDDRYGLGFPKLGEIGFGATAFMARELPRLTQGTASPALALAPSASGPLIAKGADRDPLPLLESPALQEAPRSIQRDPVLEKSPRPSNIYRDEFNNGFTLVQTPALGRATLYYQDRIWVNFTWDPGKGPDERKLAIKIDPDTLAPIPRLSLKVDVNYRVGLQVNQATEQYMADRAALSMEVAIEANGRGELTTFPARGGPSRSEPLPAKTLTPYAANPNAVEQPRIIHQGEVEIIVPPTTPATPITPGPLLSSQQQVWIQKDQKAFEEFAKNHPDTNWAGITLPDGRVVAFAMTEDMLRIAANRVRSRDYSLPFQSAFPGSHVTGIVLHGKVLPSVNDLENLYYSEDLLAAIGVTGDYKEAEVFSLGNKSYGRKPLSHSQAVARWAELDAMPIAQLAALETEPGHKFVMLWASGVSQIRALDVDYFRARSRLIILPQFAGGLLIDDQDPMMKVLEVEADREIVSAPIQTFLIQNEPTANALQNNIVHRVEAYANGFAVRALKDGMEPFERIVNSDSDAAQFLLTLASSNDDRRREMLGALGYGKLIGGVNFVAPPSMPGAAGWAIGTALVLKDEFKSTMNATGSRENVLRLMLGETIDNVSLKTIRERAADTAYQFRKTIDSLGDPENPKLKILYQDGEMGKVARAFTYRAMGFKIKPEDYPHRGQTKGALPGAMAPGSFSNLTEQMYANYSAHNQTIEDLKLAAEIVAAIVITFISEGVGATAAAEWFAGSMAARMVISGLTFTALQTGFDAALSGKSPIDPNDVGMSFARLGGEALMNIAMFAFFKQLDAVFGAFSRRGVQTVFGLTEAQFAKNTIVKGAANLIRISGLTTVFTTLSFDQFVIANGRPPSSREAARMAIKSVASIASMEVAGSLVKSMMSEGGFFGRARKLDLKTTERENLLKRIHGVNDDLLSTGLDPDQLNGKAPGLAGRYESLLNDQKQMVTDLQPEIAKKDDPADVKKDADAELARIEASLDALHQAILVGKSDMTPAGDPAAAADATEFTYADTPEGRKAIIDQFGASKAKIDKDGVITVTRADGAQLTIRPRPAGSPAPETEVIPSAGGSDPSGKTTDTPADKTAVKADEKPQEKTGEKTSDKGSAQKPDQKAGAGADPAATPAANAPLDFFTRRAALVRRRFSLLRRARATGVLDIVPEFGPGSARSRAMTKAELDRRVAAQNAIRNMLDRSPWRLRSERNLPAHEQEMTDAEVTAGPELDRLSDLAFARHKERLAKAGMSFDNVRTGRLSKLTDRQIGDALAEIPAAQGLNEAQLRGIMFAAYGNGAGDVIDMQRVFDMAGSAAERNAVLEWFGQLMEQSVPGTFEVLQTMTTSRNNWRGGLHVLDFAINGTGGTAVATFEFPEALSESGDVSEGGRIYDIVLADGTRIQGKNWRNWFGVRGQFRRDILLMTARFANPNGLNRIRWVFRAPSPQAPAEIRDTMRQTLEDTMDEFKLADETRVRLRDAFNAHTGLVEEWAGTPFPGAAAVAPPAATTGTPAGTATPGTTIPSTNTTTK